MKLFNNKKNVKLQLMIIAAVILLVASIILFTQPANTSEKSDFTYIGRQGNLITYVWNDDGTIKDSGEEELKTPSYFPKFYLPSYEDNQDLNISVDTEKERTQITFENKQGQIFSVHIEKASFAVEKYAERNLESYHEVGTIIDGQSVSLYCSDNKNAVLFELDSIIYYYYEYQFDMDELINDIIKNMKRQTVKY